jgi:hypothetical protein
VTIKKQHYALVDFENVQDVDLELVEKLPVKVVILCGQNQKHISMDLFRKACAMPGRVEVIEASGTGKNALDFQIACYAGRLVERVPEAFVHFVSKDKGFDTVVKYLISQKRLAERADSFASLNFLAPKGQYASYTLAQKIDHVMSRLRKVSNSSRPRKLRTLRSTVNAMFVRQLDEAAVEEILNRLVTEGKVTVGANESVTYAF